MVTTQGFFVFACEDEALYISREDAFHGLGYNGLVLDGSVHSSDGKEDSRATVKECHLQYVTLEGTFHKLGRGHLHAYYAGALRDLTIIRIHRKFDDIPPLRTKEPEKGGP
jgi:hypothetical protein